MNSIPREAYIEFMKSLTRLKERERARKSLRMQEPEDRVKEFMCWRCSNIILHIPGQKKQFVCDECQAITQRQSTTRSTNKRRANRKGQHRRYTRLVERNLS